MMDSHASNQEDAEEDSLVTWPLDTRERERERARRKASSREEGEVCDTQNQSKCTGKSHMWLKEARCFFISDIAL